MRPSNKARLELEAMESKLLLTAAQAVQPMSVSSVVSPLGGLVTNHLLILNGNANGNYRGVTKTPDVGTKYTFLGHGHFGSIGNVSIKGEISKVGFIAIGNPSGTITLNDSRGSLTLRVTGTQMSGPNGLPTDFNFQIAQGTGRYRHSTGSGTLSLSLTVDNTKPGILSTSGKFQMSFQTVTPVRAN